MPTVLSLLIAVAILLPLVVSFGLSGLDSLGEAVSSPSFNGITLFTLRQAVLSTSLALLAGLPAAIYFSRSRSRISKLLGLTTYIPFFFPGISMAIGFLAIYGRNGLLNSTLALFGFERLQILYSFGAILLGHVFYNAPIVILILGNALKRIPSDLLEMARMDGAGKLTRFLKVELPLAVPALVNSALLIFSYCFTSFAVVLILGGAQFATLEVSIYMYFRLLGRPQMAVALSVIQFAFIMLFGVLISISERRIPFEQGEQYIEKKTVTRLYSMLFLVFEWVPILGAFASSFYDQARGEFIFARVVRLFQGELPLIGTSLARTVFNSLSLSTVASVTTVGVTFYLAWTARKIRGGAKQLKIVSLLALSVTPSMMAISYLTTFDFLPVPFLMLLLYSLVALPVSLNYINGQVQNAELDFLEAATLDGASRVAKLRYMILPFFKNTLFYAGTVVFAISMGEFGGSLILGAQDFPTFAVAIYRLNGSRYLLEARFLSSILGLMVILAVAIAGYLLSRSGRSNRSIG